MVDPSSGNSFVTELKHAGADYTTQLAVRRSPYPDEHLVHKFETFVLSNRRVVSLATGAHAPIDQQLAFTIAAEYSKPPSHAHGTHMHGHPIYNLLTGALAIWSNEQARSFVPEIESYKIALRSGDPAREVATAITKPQWSARIGDKARSDDIRAWKEQVAAFSTAAEQLGITVTWA